MLRWSPLIAAAAPRVAVLGLAAALLVLPQSQARADRAAAPAGPLQVPEGFVVEQAAGPPQVTFPMFAAWDDRGRLYVAEVGGSQRIQRFIPNPKVIR